LNTTGSANDSRDFINSPRAMHFRREKAGDLLRQGVSHGDSLTDEHCQVPDTWMLTEESEGCLGFMNDTLCSIDRLRHPVDFPDLKAGAESGATGARGVKKGVFLHGSSEECRLQGRLLSLKKAGSRNDVEKAREELHRYWRRIIDSEYDSIPCSDLTGKFESIKKSFNGGVNPFVRYRLHALARRGRELRDEAIVGDIEKMRMSRVPGPSQKGRELAGYAEASATGEGGYCYQHVANALDRLGINLTGESAYMAAEQLAGHGRVREIKLAASADLKNLPAGAIVVWDRNEDHQHGHISVALGNGLEASDVIRAQITDYGSRFRVFMPLDC
jgi:hypothetical protein